VAILFRLDRLRCSAGDFVRSLVLEFCPTIAHGQLDDLDGGVAVGLTFQVFNLFLDREGRKGLSLFFPIIAPL
jgi:hypothetical protein